MTQKEMNNNIFSSSSRYTFCFGAVYDQTKQCSRLSGNYCVFKLALVTLFFFITSCSTLSSAQREEIKHPSLLSAYSVWSLSGKISVQEKNETATASLHWHQEGEVYRIVVAGPVGTETLVIRGRPHQVSLETSQGETSAENEAALLKQVWGKTLPITHLGYWIRGLAAPHEPARWSTHAGMTQLSQAGAQINYLEYSAIKGLKLPKKMTITLPAFKIKIAIHQWIMSE
jgi:outer membrane lipoprotein LolB